jgi:6-pyruvoyl-tetrahydropterin synthase
MLENTLFLRDFSVLDYAYFDPRLGLQGESLYVSAALEGELDAQGFIFDFGPAKKLLKKIVDERLDHKFLVPKSLSSLSAPGENFEYEAPLEAIERIDSDSVNREALEAFLEQEARAVMPPNVRRVRFHLREDPRFLVEANFRYTHGLRLHEGNCQRLFHGHRNPVEVWLDGQRAPQWEGWLAREWEGAHFVHQETLRGGDFQLGRRQKKNPAQVEIYYRSPQGEFRAKMPASRIIVLATEPSIENIARLGYQLLEQEGLMGHTVVAYEGLNKGSSFTSKTGLREW